MVGLCAAGVAVTPFWTSASLAQQAAQTVDVTTVSPLVITPGPQVGAGATFFSLQDLSTAALDARAEAAAARDAGRECKSNQDGASQSEANGDFTLEALYNTESTVQFALQTAAEAAQAATQVALDARSGGRDSAAAELARQTAVKAYQAASARAVEAHLRVADLQDQMRLHRDENPRQLQAYVDAKTLERSRNGGVAGVFVPDQYKDLALSDIAAQAGQDKGAEVLKISGRISNPRKGAIAIPPMWFTAVDRYGTPLKSQQTIPEHQGRIPPGGSLPFTFELKPMPDKTARAVVTFAPQNRPPLYMPASMFCAGAGAGGTPPPPAQTGPGDGGGGRAGAGAGRAGAGRAGGAGRGGIGGRGGGRGGLGGGRGGLGGGLGGRGGGGGTPGVTGG